MNNAREPRQPRMQLRAPTKTIKGQLHRRRVLEFLMFTSLWIVGFLAFQAYPLLQSLEISMSTASIGSAGKLAFKFVWLKNFRNALTVDANFTHLLIGTIVTTIFEMPLIIAFSITAAVLLNQRLWGTTFFRGLFFLPVVIGSSSVMAQLTNTNHGGGAVGGVPLIVAGRVMAGLYTTVGPTLAGFVRTIYQGLALMLWKSGVQVLLFLAGLYGVPQTYYEVARIDGASGWQTFLRVTLPALSPMILLVSIYTLVDSFTNPQINSLLGYMAQLQSSAGAAYYSEASAMGWIYFLVIFIILLLVFGYARNHVYYAGER